MSEGTNDRVNFMERHAERMKRLHKLHSIRYEARIENHNEVVAEETRNKLPKNYEAKKRRAEWILEDLAKREEALKQGKDYDRIKLRSISAEEAERLERKKKIPNPDQGFSTYEQASLKQYYGLVKDMPPPDMDHYKENKRKYGDAFYGGLNFINHGMHQDRKKAIDRLVTSVQNQCEKRAKYSRRRKYNDDADVDYINERNAKFNKKLERCYGTHTAYIKESLERGTAI